jgi:leader peptidase (prepilin peptidase)/N-methyltransferase
VYLARGAEFARWTVWTRWAVYLTHMALASALIVSSAIDFKYKEIYTAVTNSGMVLAVLLSLLVPELQSQSYAPAWFGSARLNAGVSSLLGLVVGGGVIWITALLGRLVFRREAMGFGDVLLMGMIGAVLGWEGALIVFFIGPFFGLFYGVWRLVRRRDHEVPYGPFLSMAAGVVLLTQPAFVAWFGPGLTALWRAARGG